MTILDVDQMTVAVHVPGDTGEGRRRRDDADRVVRRVAGDSLARGLDAAGLPADGEWCVRRVAATLAYAEDTSSARLESDWADALIAALEASLAGLAGTSSDVVHYRRRDDAVLDLVASLASGRSERSWAWRQLGLGGAGAADDRHTVLTVLEQHPHLALAAVRAAVGARGAAGLHRLLGSAGWLAVARLAARACGAPGVVETADASADPTAAATRADDTPALRDPPPSPLLRALGTSGVRPDRRTAVAWAVLALLDADSASLGRPDGPQRIARLARYLAPRPPSPVPVAEIDALGPPDSPPEPVPHGLAVLPSHRQPLSHASGAPETAPPQVSDEVPGEEPGDPDDTVLPEPAPLPQETPSQHPTAWAGLVFLLGSAERAGLPGLLASDRFGNRDTRWVVHQVAGLMAPTGELEPDDPARLALCGLPPSAPAPSGADATVAELAALGEFCDAWSRATLALLAHSDTSAYAGLDARSAVARMAARRGSLSGEPGWLDVALALDEVDVDVRVAGLDLDPGWVPWLGMVVRFRYE